MLSLLAKKTKDMDDIPMAFVGVCFMIAVVRKEVFPCPLFDLESETRDTYGDMLAIHLAKNAKETMGMKAKGMRHCLIYRCKNRLMM